METISQQAANLRSQWETDQRWAGIKRDYTAQDVIRLRGSVVEEHTLARRGAQPALGAAAQRRTRCARSAPSPATRRCRW